MAIKRLDNIGIVVEKLDAAIDFFIELGLELEGRAPIEGDWADGVTGQKQLRRRNSNYALADYLCHH